ncbi:MAG: hypothetical protein H6907_20255 [Hyphomicrobiales bacterium]|nr:hypothetical protein [Hyphomicrobiales bacterium]MCP5374074.1 hypothetical protein [Hyphomicrobiales bacterium]
MISRLAALLAAAAVAACATAQDYVDAYAVPAPTVDRLFVCHGYGCRQRTPVRIMPDVTGELVALFQPASADAAQERDRLARALALLEERVGATIGTDRDEAGATLFGLSPLQLDCIDETVNTTTYLRAMGQLGLMRFHRIGTAAQRGLLWGDPVDDYVTNTAVIVEVTSGAEYAVDTFFYANGRPPRIMPLARWRANWRPDPDDPNLIPLPAARR